MSIDFFIFIEWHHSDKILWHFGMIQYIFDPPENQYTNVHRDDCRGIQELIGVNITTNILINRIDERNVLCRDHSSQPYLTLLKMATTSGMMVLHVDLYHLPIDFKE